MRRTPKWLWERYQKHCSQYPALGLALDISRMNFPDNYFDTMEPRLQKAFAAMAALEGGQESDFGASPGVRSICHRRGKRGSAVDRDLELVVVGRRGGGAAGGEGIRASRWWR